MGTVFAAHDERLERPVALKVIRHGSDTPSARQRFWQEARVAARASHPNICQLYEIGEQDDSLFIAMEFLEGESLADRLVRGALPLSESVRIALDMLSALGALHASGIVHRDLKPSNVFLSTHALKLLDFGLAKTVDVSSASEANETATVLTKPGEGAVGEPLDPHVTATRDSAEFLITKCTLRYRGVQTVGAKGPRKKSKR